MLRILIFAGVLGLTVAADVLVINKISRTTSDSKEAGAEQIEICFTGGSKAKAYDHFHLSVILDMDDGTQDQGKSIAVTGKCATFAGDINLLGTNPVEFILTGQNKDDATQDFGTAIVKLPVFLPQLIAHWLAGDALRVKTGDDVNGFQIGTVGCTKGDGVPCYFLGIETPADNKPVLQLCKTVTEEAPGSKTIIICDLTQKNAQSKSKAVEISAMNLQYNEDKSAQIITVERGDVVTSEIVVYDENSIIKVCGTPTASPVDCLIPSYKQGDKDISVLMVGIASDPVDSKVLPITDLNLVGTALSATLLEIRWTRKSGVTDDKYHAVRTAGALKKDFTETVVTCSDLDDSPNFHCFAYFTGLTAGKSYDVTVQPGDGTSTNVDTNKVTLTGTPTPASPSFNLEGMELKISSVNTKWHKGLRSFEVNTCVYQSDTSDLSTYDAILINKRGQWKKVNGATQRIGYEFCFDALHVDMYNFDLSEDMTLVVVKRGHDGITVLETAQTDIYVGANQKAAELRNSSSGTM